MTRFTPTERGEPCAWATAARAEAPAWWLRCDGCAKRCKRRYDSQWEKRREARQNGPRAFPKPTGGNRGKFGFCQWCGEACLHHDGPKAGQQNMRRGWHDGRADEPDCLLAYYLHTRVEFQFRHVAARDGEHCWDCGGTPERWLRTTTMHGCLDWNGRADWVGPFCELKRVGGLEVDHEVPLWSVSHLPDDERAAYFGPVNLRLRCASCHKKKSAIEAKDRARVKAEGR